MIKVFNKGKTIVYVGNVCLKPLQEMIIENHEEEKINKAFSLAKLGLVKTTLIKEPEVKTVSVIEEIPVQETKSSKPKTKKKTNKKEN